MKTSMSDDELRKSHEEWEKAKEEAAYLKNYARYKLNRFCGLVLDELLSKIEATPYSAEYWCRHEDIKALRFVKSIVDEYIETGECKRIHSGLCDLYVIDKHSRQIHRVGEHDHDSLCSNLGYVDYYNMQCGDGGGVDSEEGYGYAILQSEHGYLADEYGIIDKQYVKEILQYLKEQGEDISKFDENGNYIREE